MQENENTPAGALWAAAAQGDITLVSHVIAEGVDVNLWDRYRRSALTLAAGGGHLDIVRVLLAGRAWVDPHDNYSTFQSPLMCAAEKRHIEVVELRLEKGANPTLYGGIGGMTAEVYARGESAERRFLSAILLRAENEWRRQRS